MSRLFRAALTAAAASIALATGSFAPVSAAARLPLMNGPRTSRRVALTFDADFSPAWTLDGRRYVNDALISLLERERVHATLFITGLWARQYPGEMRRLVRDGLFEFANHSWSHPAFARPCFRRLPVIPYAEDADQITRADRVIASFAPHRSRFFRFPGGCYDAPSLANVEALGFEPVQWDVVSGDAFQRDPVVIERDVLSRVREGSIVVAHMHGANRAPATAPAFARIIPALRARGYSFVTVSELLPPPAPARAAPRSHRAPALLASGPSASPLRRGHALWWLWYAAATLLGGATVASLARRTRRG